MDVPASIRKADIAACGSMKGGVNVASFLIDDVRYPARRLRYLGFAGGLDLRSGRYVGVQRFDMLAEGDPQDPSVDFNAIPGMGDKSVGAVETDERVGNDGD